MAAWKTLARAVFDYSGGVPSTRWLNRNSLRVLMYHRFTLPEHDPAGTLDRQCAHFRKHYHPLSLKEVSVRLQEKAAFPANALAVTVDDGYRDFYTTAHRIFQAHRIPVTVFLPTDFLDGKDWLWRDCIGYAVRQTRLRAVEMELAGDGPRTVLLETPSHRKEAAMVIVAAAKRMPNAERLKLLDDLPQAFEISWPGAPPTGCEPMTWQEVRQLAKQGVEFGGHSKSYPILSRINNEAELREEIEDCKRRIEAELGQPVLHFSYPNGKEEDVPLSAIDWTKKAGYQTGLMAEVGLNWPGVDAFLLKRIGVDLDFPEDYFRRTVAGFRLHRQGAGLQDRSRKTSRPRNSVAMSPEPLHEPTDTDRQR